MIDDACRDELFAVITHLVSSSVTSLRETPALAAYRMIDAADRLSRILSKDGPSDEFLEWAHREFEENTPLAMSDQAAFLAWLHDYARGFVRTTLARQT